ncbi:hypothetical protein FRC02_009437 [Tulasnella sp. 418]|nr:hypothetical protein FRC02_009437 [Tulasnella sp. 418]
MQTTTRTTTATAADPRQKMTRSATTGAGAMPTAPHPRRSLSEDSRERSAANGIPRSRHKAKDKASAHADVIDKLDYSGLGGGMFHHDGPFDACAPSRNRHKNHRAPINAFNGDPAQGGAANPHNVPVIDKRLSPLAQATIAAMASSDGHGPYGAATQGSFPNPNDRTAWAPVSPRKTTLAEAWGKAEPEPFEEFSAGTITRSSPAPSLDYEGGYEGHYRRNRAREAELPPRRSKLPPPQPIALPGFNPDQSADDQGSPTLPYSPEKPGGMKRSKSIMQRIRKMRDNPNVPLGGGGPGNGYDAPYTPMKTPGVGPVYEEDYATDVPTNKQKRGQHKHSNSQGSGGAPAPPAMRPRGNSLGETYYSEPREKALPAPPPPSSYNTVEQNGGGYFDKSGPGGAGIGRKTSLYAKMKGVVGR